MKEYTTATCATCRQAVYIPRRLVKNGYWDCFACGATNIALGTVERSSAPLPPSRFARRRVIDLTDKEDEKLPLLQRIVRRLNG